MKQSSEKFVEEMLKDSSATVNNQADFAKILDERIDAAMKKYTENLEKLINPTDKLEVIKEEKEIEENEEGSTEGNAEGIDDSGNDC